MSAQLEQEIRQLTSQLQLFVQAQSTLTSETRRTTDAQREATKELEAFEDELVTSTHHSKRQSDLYNKALVAKQKSIKLNQRILVQQNSLTELLAKQANGEILAADAIEKNKAVTKRLQDAEKKANEEANKAQRRLISSTNDLSGSFNRITQSHGAAVRGMIGSMGHTGSSLLNLTDGIMSASRTLNPATAALAIFTSAVIFAYNAISNYTKAAMKISAATGGVLEGSNFDEEIINHFNKAFKMGIDPIELSKMSAGVRQTTNAFGGIDSALAHTSQIATDLFPLSGDIATATKDALQAMSDFRAHGIKPTTKALNQYKNDIYTQSKVSGMGIEESTALFNRMASDSDMISQLKTVREDEREAILANQRALLASNIALGMLPTQAEAAGKALIHNLSQKPKERFAKAAKIEAFAGAIGMGAEGHVIANQFRAARGPKDLAAASQSLTRLTNAADQMAGASIQSEFFISSLMEGLQVEDEFGLNSSFSSTLYAQVGNSVDKIAGMMVTGEGANVSLVAMQQRKFEEQIEQIKSGNILTNQIISQLDGMSLTMPPWISTLGEGIITIGSFIMDLTRGIGDGISMLTNGIGFVISKATASILGLFGPNSGSIAAGKDADDFSKSFTASLIDANSILHKDAEKTNQTTPTEKTPSEPSTTKAPIEKPPTPIEPKPLKTPPEKVIVPENKPEQTIETSKKLSTYDNATKTATATVSLLELSEKCNAKLDNQITQLNQSNNYLKIIADSTPILLDLAQKQLVATTMDQAHRDKYMSRLSKSNNNLAAEYASIN